MPDRAANRLLPARAEPDLLLARGELGLTAVEVGNCGFLGGRGNRGDDFADSILGSFLLYLEDVADRIVKLRRGWTVLRRHRERFQPRENLLRRARRHCCCCCHRLHSFIVVSSDSMLRVSLFSFYIEFSFFLFIKLSVFLFLEKKRKNGEKFSVCSFES